MAADGSGTHTTVQAALNAATGSARRYILVKPGTYRGQVSYTGSTPVTIYGASTDASQVIIINNMSAAQGASQTFLATVVIEGSTIHYLSSRRGSSAGVIFAPSTSVANNLGFLVIRCNFTADAAAPANKNHLGRSWDASSTTPTPNGQAVIRESTIGGHINKAAPWTAAATSGRAYSATGNRFNEYCNSGPGAGP